MRNAVIAVAVVTLLSGCGGKSQPPVPSVNITTTVVPKKTHAQLLAAAAAARQAAKAAARARAQGYTVHAGDPAGYKILNTTLSHRGCSEFGNHGCWRVEIVTFQECSFFEMDIDELRRGAVVETYVDNQSDVMPNTPLHGEFDATEDNVTLGTPVFTCT